MVREHIAEPGTGTERVSAFLSETRFEDIPAAAVRVAKDALVDWLAVALAGSRDRSTGIIGDYLKEFGARGEASVIGKGFRTTAELAALANGTIGHALDFDDTFANSTRYNLHPSTCVFPATLALIEREGLTGRDLLAAYITGMEVTYRLGKAIGHLIPKTGWHSTPVMGTMGATAAGINALHLTPEQARNALGIGASLAGGLLRNTGTMTKPMHAGNGARNGVIATLLAKR
ncbi:MAG: MmgE/PrpD family protein, partial [Chloroflexota bacterium]